MPRRRKIFAKVEIDFVQSDPRFNSLTPADQTRYLRLWIEAKRNACEILPIHACSPAALARLLRVDARTLREPHGATTAGHPSLSRLTTSSIGRIAAVARDSDPLIKMLSDGTIRVCGCSKVHGKDDKGNWYVYPDVDVDVDKTRQDVDLDALVPGTRSRAKQRKPRDADTKRADHASRGKSTPSPAPPKTHRTPEEGQAELNAVTASETYQRLQESFKDCTPTPVESPRPQSLMKREAEAKAAQEARVDVKRQPKTPRQQKREEDPPSVGQVLDQG